MAHNPDTVLQSLCRDYLSRLRYMAGKHGLGSWLSDVIKANERGECSGTEKEVRMLSRLVDDERVARADIPVLLGKSYRECCDDDDFGKIAKLHRVGLYSKVSALLFAAKQKKDEKVKK